MAMKDFKDIKFWFYQLFDSDPTIRVYTDEYKRPWYVARRVALKLGYEKDPNRSVRKFVSEENRSIIPIKTPGGIQQMLCISLDGVFELLAKSKTKVGEEYRKMTNMEINPTIYQTGAYFSDVDEYIGEKVNWPIEFPLLDLENYESWFDDSNKIKHIQRDLHDKNDI